MSTLENTKGRIDILNTGHGHLEVRFNPEDPMEVDKASRTIQDMLKRGYVLFIHGSDEKLVRVNEFDATKGVYYVSDVPSGLPDYPTVERRGRPQKEVPVSEVQTTAVGRSAGG